MQVLRKISWKSVTHRLKEEFFNVVVLAIYFAVYFSALTYLKFSILEKVDVAYNTYGLCWIRALICAKFMEIGLKIYPIKSTPDKPLVRHILNRSLIYVMIVNLHILVEQLVVAAFHHKSLIAVFTDWPPGSMNQAVALEILYWLMLVPYITYFAVSQSLETGRLRKIIWGVK